MFFLGSWLQDELLAELEELEALELDEQLLEPATAVPTRPVVAGPSSIADLPSVPGKAPVAPQRAPPSKEEDELEKLRAEMAM